MTSFDDSSAKALFKATLNRSWRPVRFRPQALAIQAKAEELEQKFGGVPRELALPPNLLKEAERLLTIGQGNISGLSAKQRKAVPHILWTSPHGWSENARLVDDYFAWADQNWRTAPRRLWQHYLLNMQPDSLATQSFAHWLEARADRLTPPLRDFSMHWELFQPERAVIKIAGSLLAGAHLIDEIIELRVDRDTLLRSACLLSVLKALGQRLREHPHAPKIPVTLKQLLANLGENPIHKMQGQYGLGQAAQKSVVEGLVIWADRQNDEDIISQTLDLVHTLIGDPRLYPARWAEIDSNVRQTVEQWLAKITLDTFFQVMRELHTDRDDMVIERERFWTSYKNKINNAWLVTGLHGRQLALKMLKTSFGEFDGGAMPDHLGLVLQIKDYVILEMNKNGRTLFWRKNDPNIPINFFAKQWNLIRLRNLCSATREEKTDRFHMKHQPAHGWQSKYETEILRRTGVSRSN